MVASAGVYETAAKGAEALGLVPFLGARDRFLTRPTDALVKAIGSNQRAFHVRVRVEILGEVEAAVVPRKEGKA